MKTLSSPGAIVSSVVLAALVTIVIIAVYRRRQRAANQRLTVTTITRARPQPLEVDDVTPVPSVPQVSRSMPSSPVSPSGIRAAANLQNVLRAYEIAERIQARVSHGVPARSTETAFASARESDNHIPVFDDVRYDVPLDADRAPTALHLIMNAYNAQEDIEDEFQSRQLEGSTDN
jgi:hypothetical protein